MLTGLTGTPCNEVSERFYMELIPQAREIAAHAAEQGQTDQAAAVNKVIDDILARPAHDWRPKNLAAKLATIDDDGENPEKDSVASPENTPADGDDGEATPPENEETDSSEDSDSDSE